MAAIQEEGGVKLRVEVTEEDIDLGVRRNPEWCPVALALIRCPGVRYAQVFGSRAFATLDDDRELALSLPDKANDFIVDFDSERRVRPFMFYARETAA